MMLSLTSNRTCGSCTACCKTHDVKELGFEKVAGVWCKHCKPGSGCRIYKDRPSNCREFRCDWLKGVGADEERPDRSKVVLDYVVADDLPANGILQMWEVSEGALTNAFTRRWTEFAFSRQISVTHLYLSGRKVFFAPPGLLTIELQVAIQQGGFELGKGVPHE